MSSYNKSKPLDSHRQPMDLSSEGAAELVRDLLKSGYSVRIKVSGRSMRPFLKGDEIVILGNITIQKLKIGDLVLYTNDEGQPVLHRVARFKKRSDKVKLVQTKGDGLISFDKPVEATKILARVTRIEVQKAFCKGKPVYINIDLTSFRQRVKASLIVIHGLVRYIILGCTRR